MINLLIMFIGFLIRLIAIRNLNGNFSTAIGIPDKICSNGLYKIIRHPCYVGSIVIFCGLCYDKTIGFAVVLLAILFFYDRADREETILRAKFGQEYDEYISKTGMFFPIIRRS